ncbi:glycosyltransferase family 4 protein [Nitrosomonadaceae bacterium]|nr:glycosyltransferase family 4 protein [Nitrosomonadaceae bacterium]
MVTLSLIWWLIKGNTLKILDRPNSRSLHTTPVTRTGGLGVLSGILISWALLPTSLPLYVWIGVSLLVAVSFADDVLTLPVWWRLLAHSAVAAWFAVILLADVHGWLMATVATVAIVWMINLYNFMDGSDGLAGGMTLIGFSCYGLAAWLVGNEAFAMLNFCIAAAAAAFLLFNSHPARIFMGDVGAIPLGFLAGSFGILGWANGLWTLWLPILVFSPFIADASVTLAKRCLRREKIWQAHREHYYQRLVESGFGHRNTALLGYVLMLAAGTSAIWAARQDSIIQLGVGAVWCGFYLAMMLAFDGHGRRRNSG